MPELPDLQVFSKNLQSELSGKKLQEVIVNKLAKINVPAKKLKQSVEHSTLKQVYREGKELRLKFSKGNIIGLHMMLHGKLQWFDKEPPKYTLVEFKFTGNKNLALTDFQRKASTILDPEPSNVPDALSTGINAAFWKKALARKTAIKKLLLDQHVIRGIGNAYADEILWEARISPFTAANTIPPGKVKDLTRALRKVLKNAEKQIAKKDPHIIGGEIRDFLVIHNASKKTSPTGASIKVATAGGRKTYYTDEQQSF